MDCAVHWGGDYRIEAAGAAGGYDKHPNSLQYRGRGARMRKLTPYPSFFNGRVQSACSKHSQREPNLEMQFENARFQRNAWGVLVLRHVPGCTDLRS